MANTLNILSPNEVKSLGGINPYENIGATSSAKSSDTLSADEVKSLGGINPYSNAPTQPQGATLTGADNPVGSLPVIKQLTQFGAGLGSATIGAGLNLGKALFKGAQGIAN